MRDVAEAAGVDRSIVSRTLNGRPDARVSGETRQRILDAVAALGYQPNAVARGLRLSRTSTFGLIVPDVSNPIYAQVVQGAQARAAERGYVILVGDSQDSEDSEASYARLVSEGRVDALLVASGAKGDDTLRRLAATDAVLVTVNRRIRGVIASVVLDDVTAGRIAARHLIELGHTRLCMIVGNPGVDTGARRKEGFAAETKHLARVVYSEPTRTAASAGAEAARQVLSKHPEITGIVVYSLRAAVGAQFAIQEMGLRIPEDVSLVTIHDDPFAEYAIPPLTAIRMPMRELGAAAVDMAFERLEGKPPRAQILHTAPQLIVRRSTAAPAPRH
jgi:LacI family transcriptional regulator